MTNVNNWNNEKIDDSDCDSDIDLRYVYILHHTPRAKPINCPNKLPTMFSA